MVQILRILSLSRKRKKLGKIEDQVEELHQLVPVIERLAGLLATLDALGPHLATLDALGPHLATLDALGPRLTLLDQLSHNFNSFNADFQTSKSQLGSFGEFTEMTENLRPIVKQYLEQNHLISESVRLDVEALTVHLTALQLQIDRLSTTIMTESD